tara:strand:+ start:187 stop:348 length:162 start_codon:yes stop_codon:yes gene_type:complete
MIDGSRAYLAKWDVQANDKDLEKVKAIQSKAISKSEMIEPSLCDKKPDNYESP